MITHLKPREYYEDLYDRVTVKFARRNLASFTDFHNKFYKKFPDEKPDSDRSKIHFNWFYMILVGNNLLERNPGYTFVRPHV